MPPVPPIFVAAIASGRVPTETLEAVRTALLAQIAPMAGGRPVLPLISPDRSAAIAACADAPCLGAQIASAGAIGAIVARLSRRGARGPIEVRIEMIDPISGASRTPPIVYSLTAQGAAIGDALAPLIEQLRAAMFAPPPPPPQILITVNVDGATVRIDDESIGESPLAPQIVAPGRHVIMVTRAGYSGVRHEIDVDPGENERIDITLREAVGGIESSERGEGAGQSRGGSATEWYENWLVWLGIGGGVVVVALVIGISVGVVTSQPPRALDPMGIPLPPIQ